MKARVAILVRDTLSRPDLHAVKYHNIPQGIQNILLYKT